MDSIVRITNWNVEWQPTGSKAAEIIRRRIWRDDPDIVCLMETYLDFIEREGHVIAAEADYGYLLVEGRRKVLLWSKTPWTNVDTATRSALPSGRYVSGKTVTAAGEVSVLGLCVPWEEAHVRTGRRDRARWEDHLAYLAALDELIDIHATKTIVVGDYNQRVPRKRTPPNVYAALERAILSKTVLSTAGPIPPLEKLTVDHVAHTPDMKTVRLKGISDRGPAGEKLSDHFGVHVRISCVV